MSKKSIYEVAKTYKLMLESIDPQQGGSGNYYNDLADLLLTHENPTSEQLQNITPKPKDFHNGYYDWYGDRWVVNVQRYNQYMEEMLRVHAIRIAEARAAQAAEEMVRRGVAAAKGRRAILAQVIASLAAAGLAIYLSLEEIQQIVDDYYNPEMPQADVPNNFELYQPLSGMWNNATTVYEPPYRDPIAP